MTASRKDQSDTYEHNFAVLEKITDALNKDEIGIDDLLEKTREALDAARRCMEILNRQKGEFRKLEAEFARLIESPETMNADKDGEPDETADEDPLA
ncbi:MAG: exodeoxyribonuclease VII small subunit [Acidobacteriota bacterium]|jgi:exonuclease VII small subunit|nr:exodeoxyribonuclease VII small subunit [Acidobacteriota bacterium]